MPGARPRHISRDAELATGRCLCQMTERPSVRRNRPLSAELALTYLNVTARPTLRHGVCRRACG